MDEIVIYIILFIVITIVVIIEEAARRNNPTTATNNIPRTIENGYVVKEPLEVYLSKNAPDFNMQTESFKVAQFLEKYILAVGTKQEDLSQFNEYCSKGVIAELSHEINITKVPYSKPKVTDVKFVDYIVMGNELTLKCIAFVDYCSGEKENLFEAKYALKYAKIVREKTSKHSLTCPSCGAPISDKSKLEKTCEFCGSKIENFNQDRSWAVVNIDRIDNRLKYIGK